ncbi:MAG: acid phosphatase [Chloroflexota bacterium]|nr:low molecular weight phosphotyrosine protein phosphatase [Chloroflexota bacterium]GIK62299.1 MAG: acid phosphatase [Chloroflexota bacterium]
MAFPLYTPSCFYRDGVKEELELIRVLFVCYANICRSTMAEGLFQHMLEQNGLTDRIETDSAGTHSSGGKTAHPNTLAILTEHGIPYNGISRRLALEDFSKFDYILAMDNENMETIELIQPPDAKAKVALLLDYAPHLPYREVADPYVHGRYNETFETLQIGLQALLNTLRERHHL